MAKYIAPTVHMRHRHTLHIQNRLFRKKYLIIQKIHRNTSVNTFSRDNDDVFKKKTIVHETSKF